MGPIVQSKTSHREQLLRYISVLSVVVRVKASWRDCTYSTHLALSILVHTKDLDTALQAGITQRCVMSV